MSESEFTVDLRGFLRQRLAATDDQRTKVTPLRTTEDVVSFINGTDVVAAIIFTDEQRELLLKYRDSIDVSKVLSNALTRELKSIDGHHDLAQYEREHLTPRGNDELPSSVAARHLVNPELGDEWGTFGRYGKIVVVKIISIDEFIVWVSDHSRIEKGFYRINRRILSLWVYTDPANAETLCDFRPHLWMAGCTQHGPESETYKGILAALHEDYNHAINLL